MFFKKKHRGINVVEGVKNPSISLLAQANFLIARTILFGENPTQIHISRAIRMAHCVESVLNEGTKGIVEERYGTVGHEDLVYDRKFLRFPTLAVACCRFGADGPVGLLYPDCAGGAGHKIHTVIGQPTEHCSVLNLGEKRRRLLTLCLVDSMGYGPISNQVGLFNENLYNLGREYRHNPVTPKIIFDYFNARKNEEGDNILISAACESLDKYYGEKED